MSKLLSKAGRLFKAGRILGLPTLVLILVLGWQQISPAQMLAQSTTQLESRVSRLESENTTLRSQVSQLQTSVARLGRSSGVELTQPIVLNSAPAIGSGLADDPVFKRLATLVIELKERVVAVEDRLSSSGGSSALR
jgi:hypothetical protein